MSIVLPTHNRGDVRDARHHRAPSPRTVFDQELDDGVTLAEVLAYVAQHLGAAVSDDIAVTSAGTQQPRLQRRRIAEESPLLVALSPFAPSAASPPVGSAADSTAADATQADPQLDIVFRPAAPGEVAAAVVLSPTRIAIANRHGFVDIWQVPELVRISRTRVSQGPQSLALSPDRRTIAALNGESWTSPTVTLLDVATGSVVRDLGAVARRSASLPKLAWTPDSRELLIAVENAVLLIDAATGDLRRRFEHRSVGPTFLIKDGADLVTVSLSDGEVRVWSDWRTAKTPTRTFSIGAALRHAAPDASGELLAAVSGTTVDVFRIAAGAAVSRYSAPHELYSAEFSGTTLLVAGRSPEVVQLSALDGRPIRRFSAQAATYFGGVVPGPTTLVGFGLDDILQTWSLEDGRLIADNTLENRYHVLQISSTHIVVAGRTGQQLVSARLGLEYSSRTTPVRSEWTASSWLEGPIITGTAEQVNVWDPQSLAPVATLRASVSVVVSDSRGGRFAYCVSDEKNQTSQIFLSEAAGQPRRLGGGRRGDCGGLVMDPGGSLLATTDGVQIELFEVAGARRVGTMATPASAVDLKVLELLPFSADGALASYSVNETLAIYRPRDRKVIARADVPFPLTAAAFSPDGKRLIGGSLHGDVFIVETDSGRVLDLRGVEGVARAAAFDPTGRIAGVLANDGTTNLYAATSGRLLLTLAPGRTADEWFVQSAGGAFDASPALRSKLLSRSADGAVNPITPELLAQRSDGLISRTLSDAK